MLNAGCVPKSICGKKMDCLGHANPEGANNLRQFVADRRSAQGDKDVSKLNRGAALSMFHK
jgi:hypothetical protein